MSMSIQIRLKMITRFYHWLNWPQLAGGARNKGLWPHGTEPKKRRKIIHVYDLIALWNGPYYNVYWILLNIHTGVNCSSSSSRRSEEVGDDTVTHVQDTYTYWSSWILSLVVTHSKIIIRLCQRIGRHTWITLLNSINDNVPTLVLYWQSIIRQLFHMRSINHKILF